MAKCDEGCPGLFVNEETDKVERCDLCKRLDSDSDAAAVVRQLLKVFCSFTDKAESIDAAQRLAPERNVELQVNPSAFEGRRGVEFAVQDSGNGIAPEVMARDGAFTCTAKFLALRTRRHCLPTT